MSDSYSLIKNRKELKDRQLEKYGYLFCEVCHTSSYPLECHHIVFRSEAENHPNVDHIDNLILACVRLDGIGCHSHFHKKKALRNKLVEQRNLNQLFKKECKIFNQ